MLGAALPALMAPPEAVPQRPQDQRVNVQEKRQSVLQRFNERRQAIIRSFFARMVRRYEAAILRMQKLGDRIQSRIEKARAAGRDVTQAQAALDQARSQWSQAKGTLEEVRGKLEGVLGAGDPKAAFQEVKSLLGTMKGQLKSVHQALVEAITTLKGLGGGTREGQSAPGKPPAPALTPTP
jgi:DNA repair exonuclease SbcCD ATPase subunit